MAKNIVGVIAGLAVWLAIAFGVGFIMRETWPAYVAVADAMTFTLPMMIARLAIGALATVSMGFVTACITRSLVARLIPGFILLAFFVPEHVTLWDKFPLWYHLWFLLTLIPLAYLGSRIAVSARREGALVSIA